MADSETLDEYTVVPDELLPETAFRAVDRYKISRSEVDLKVRTTYLSREMLADVRTTCVAPSLAKFVLDDRPCWEHVIATHGVMRNNRTVCDPDDLVGPQCDVVLNSIKKMTQMEPTVAYDDVARNTVVAATNSPAIVACNNVPLDYVLLCGVDKRGADFTRIQLGMEQQNIRSVVVDVVDWNAKDNRNNWPDIPGIHIRAVVSDMKELEGALELVQDKPVYTLILLNHTFTSFARFDIEFLINMMSEARAIGVNCQLVGTYWDPHAMMLSSFQGIDPITRNFSYDG